MVRDTWLLIKVEYHEEKIFSRRKKSSRNETKPDYQPAKLYAMHR